MPQTTDLIANLDADARIAAGETVDHLIARSISHTEIAHGEYDEAVAAILQAQCDDSVENGEVVEYWGTDDDGREWRVHLTQEAVR